MLTCRSTLLCQGLCLTMLCIIGCNSSSSPDLATGESGSAANQPADTNPAGSESSSPKPRKFTPVQLGDSSSPATAATTATSEAENLSSVVEALQPLQILLGQWRGTTSRKFDGFNAVDELNWVWDFKTNPNQPALVATSDKSPYFRHARITFLPATQKFELTLSSPDEEPRVLIGDWSEEPTEIVEPNQKPQRTFKLTLTQTVPEQDELWEVTFNQRENNRYLMELSRRRGQARFARFETIGTQRLGTSFALNDEDYGDKKCIISGGLGTMTVSYEGKSYPVCCSGCQAAFNDDPVKWLARLAEQEKMKKPE